MQFVNALTCKNAVIMQFVNAETAQRPRAQGRRKRSPAAFTNCMITA